MAALSRMANRDHVIRIDNGDTVQLASSLIPGNENAIYRVINDLTRWGATVVHHGNAKVHVSGHTSAGELIHCDNITRPRGVIPVHGEWRHLRSNPDLAITTGIDPSRVILAEDGVVLDLINHHAKVTGKVPAGYVYVDGTDVGGVAEASLKDRRTLATEGVVIVDTDTGNSPNHPDFLARGFPHDKATFTSAVTAIQTVLQTAANSNNSSAATHVDHREAQRRCPRLAPTSTPPGIQRSRGGKGWVRSDRGDDGGQQ